MSVRYEGLHSISFWDKEEDKTLGAKCKNTWTDFHLIPIARPYFGIPQVNYQIVGIPNSSDRINITDFIPGGQTYGPIQGEWSFFIDHNKWKDWVETRDALVEFFNGRRLTVRIDDDLDTFHEGRFSISKYDHKPDYTTVSIKYDLDYGEADQSGLLYRIRFIDYDGKVMSDRYYSSGDYPDSSQINTNKPNGLTFAGWTPEVDFVAKNMDYVATYERDKSLHYIKFFKQNGRLVEQLDHVPDGMFMYYDA